VSRPPAESLDPDVRRFIEAHVDSIELLEVLLLLRAEPARAFGPDDVATALRTSPASARERLRALATQRLLVGGEGDGYRYAPEDAALAVVVDRVAAAYRDRRVTVIGLIYARPPDAVRELARAFRVGRKDDDDA
jgi:hypothetical protein